MLAVKFIQSAATIRNVQSHWQRQYAILLPIGKQLNVKGQYLNILTVGKFSLIKLKRKNLLCIYKSR
jgi:hypothetical protein